MQRLKTRPQFQALLAADVVAKTEHFVLHCSRLKPKPSSLHQSGTLTHDADRPDLFAKHEQWIGAMVPKRWAKRAVTRNAIKRQIYSVSAEALLHYPQSALLVRMRREFSRRDFPSAESPLLKTAVRAELLTLIELGVTSA